jgi:hypothetical protein
MNILVSCKIVFYYLHSTYIWMGARGGVVG